MNHRIFERTLRSWVFPGACLFECHESLKSQCFAKLIAWIWSWADVATLLLAGLKDISLDFRTFSEGSPYDVINLRRWANDSTVVNGFENE